MKILVLTPTFLPVVGGAELVLWEVFRRLADRHEVKLLTPNLQPSLIAAYAKRADDYPLNFSVRRYQDKITFMSLRFHTLSLGLMPPFSLSAVSALMRQVREFGPDVINVHYTMPTGLAGVVANAFARTPVVLTLNGRDVPGPGVPYFWKWWHRLVARCCTDVTYVSEYCRDIVFGPGGPGTVTWNGVDFAKVNIGESRLTKEEFGGTDSTRILFSLQRLSAEKGVDIVLKSMKRIVEAEPDTLLIIGGTGPEKERLEALASALGLQGRVRFTGFIKDSELGDYFNLCDVFMFNSNYETFGIVLAQAMAYGKPVVSVQNTAIPCVVKDCGLLVPPNNPESMARAVVSLLRSPEKRAELGKRGEERARTLFDWDIIARKYEEVFERATTAL